MGAAVTLAAVLALAALTLPSGTGFGSLAAGELPVEVEVEGYPLDDSPEAAASFQGNVVVVEGTIVEIQQPRWNTDDKGDDALRFIFTPLVVRVDDVLRGEVKDDEIVVRRLGGSIGKTSYVFDDVLDDEATAVGTRLLLFLGERRDTGDGVPARTPNMTYTFVGDGKVQSVSGLHRIDYSEFKALVERTSID